MQRLLKNISLLVLLAICLTYSGSILAQPKLTDQAQISIITFGPYQGELWSAFGHNGIRVYDPNQNINWIYDYGRFSFKQANFYWNFARGMLLYSIGKADFDRYVNLYVAEDRSVQEQILNLTQQEKQSYFKFLENNYKPQNRSYMYNYVYDNCATKLKEVTEEVLTPEIVWDYSYVEEGKTVRDLMDDYLGYQPWGDLAIDLGLSMEIDGEASPEVYMFLPDYIFTAFANAKIDRDSTIVPLIAKTNDIYVQKEEPEKPGLFTPMNTFIILFFLVGLITNRDFKRGKRSKWLDKILFSLAAFVGWWFVFLWFGTAHLSKYNWNLLWAFPFHIPLIFLLTRETIRPHMVRLYRLLAVIHFLTLVLWALFPQPLHFSLIPFILTLALRSFYISYDLDRPVKILGNGSAG